MLPVLLAFFLFASAGAAFAWVAWHSGRRWGSLGLSVSWLIGTLAAAALMSWRIQQQQSAIGFTAEQQRESAPFLKFLPMWALGFGAVTLVVRARLRKGDTTFTWAVARRSFTAFLVAVAGFFVIYAIMDVAGLLE